VKLTAENCSKGKKVRKSALAEKAFGCCKKQTMNTDCIFPRSDFKKNNQFLFVFLLTGRGKCATIRFGFEKLAGLAQPVERLIRNHEVADCP